MALPIRRSATMVFPVATQPGRSGTDALQSLSGSLLIRTRYCTFLMTSPSSDPPKLRVRPVPTNRLQLGHSSSLDGYHATGVRSNESQLSGRRLPARGSAADVDRRSAQAAGWAIALLTLDADTCIEERD